MENAVGGAIGTIGNDIGGAVQGVENFFHLAPPPGAQSQQQAQTGAQVGSALGYGPTPAQTALAAASKPVPQPAPPAADPAAKLNAYIQNLANIGPKAVATSIQKPDASAGGSSQAASDNPIINIATGLAHTGGGLNPIGGLADAANSIGDATALGQNPDVLGAAAQTGVSSTLGMPAQIFGGIANELTQRLGINNGTTSADANPIFGETNSFSQQVKQQGVGATLLNNAFDILGTAAFAEAKPGEVGPTVGEAAGAVKDANAAIGERGSIGGAENPTPKPTTPTPGTPEPSVAQSDVTSAARAIMEKTGQSAGDLRNQFAAYQRQALQSTIEKVQATHPVNDARTLIKDIQHNGGIKTDPGLKEEIGQSVPLHARNNTRGLTPDDMAQVLQSDGYKFNDGQHLLDTLAQAKQTLAEAPRDNRGWSQLAIQQLQKDPKWQTADQMVKGLSEVMRQEPAISPEAQQWARDNGFAGDHLGMNKDSLTPEGVTPEQLDRRPQTGGAQLTPEIHQPNPVRNTPETPMLSDLHQDIPGKAPVDIKRPTIKLEPPKQERAIVKGFGAIKTIIKRQGQAGKELTQRIVNVRETHRQLGQALRDNVPTVLKLGKGEFKNFVDTVEGRAAPANDRVAQAITEWQGTAKAIEARAQDAGIQMGHIEDYFPHVYDNKLFTDKKTFSAAVEHLVNTGQATDIQNAVEQINQMREPHQGGHRYGNLEQARRTQLPGYKIDKSVIVNYLDRSARRIAEAEQFGRDNEHVSGLIGQMAKEGKDANAAQEAFNSYWQRPAHGVIAKTAEGGRKVSSYLTLSKAALSHSTQTVNTGIVAGHVRTAHAWVRSLSPADRAWAKSIGINYEGHAGPRVSGIAPFLKQMRAQNRIVSALAGRAYGDALAKAGKSDVLKGKWGVQGDIGAKLTDAQQAHMGHAMADATQFSDDPADLPTWARTPAGKLVGQYRMSYQYKQGGFLFDHIIKEAAHGNIVPLVRAMAIPAAGAAVVGAKHALGSKTTPGDLGADLEAGGLGTIPTSLLDSTRYLYNGPTAAATLAGDVAPLAGQLVQTGENINSATNGNAKPLEKQALGYIPFIGAGVANATFPSKPADPNAITYVQGEQAGRKSLQDTKDQGVWDALFGSNKDKAGNTVPSVYDPQNAPYVAQALLDHPNVLTAATAFYRAFAAKTGQAIDPLYNLTPSQQIAALQIRAAAAFPGELSGDKKQLATQLPADWQQQQSNYYNAVSASLQAAGKGATQPGAPQYPTPSAQVQAQLDAGNTKDPGVQSWLAQLDAYNNAKRQQMGLPQIAAYGFGPSTGQIPNPSNPYAKKLQAGTTANPTFASSGSSGGSKGTGSRGGSRATGKGSRGGKIAIAKGQTPKAVKIASPKIAKAPGVSGVKLPKTTTVAKMPRVKLAKVSKVPASRRVKLA